MSSTITEIMNIGELAEYLRLSRSTLYQLSQKGRIPGTKVGKSWRYHKEAIDEWIKDPERTKTQKKVKLLIVDDDEAVLNVLAESLRKAEDEFIVETATDGFQAGQIMERVNPDVVVLDIFLPGLDGFQVCKIIKDGHPDIRIIAITGHGDPDVKKMILKAGADEYLEKPFNLEELAGQVRELMGEMVLK